MGSTTHPTGRHGSQSHQHGRLLLFRFLFSRGHLRSNRKTSTSSIWYLSRIGPPTLSTKKYDTKDMFTCFVHLFDVFSSVSVWILPRNNSALGQQTKQHVEGKKLQLQVTKAFSENTRTVSSRLILEWIAAHYWRHFGLCLEREQQILTDFLWAWNASIPSTDPPFLRNSTPANSGLIVRLCTKCLNKGNAHRVG